MSHLRAVYSCDWLIQMMDLVKASTTHTSISIYKNQIDLSSNTTMALSENRIPRWSTFSSFFNRHLTRLPGSPRSCIQGSTKTSCQDCGCSRRNIWRFPKIGIVSVIIHSIMTIFGFTIQILGYPHYGVPSNGSKISKGSASEDQLPKRCPESWACLKCMDHFYGATPTGWLMDNPWQSYRDMDDWEPLF